MSDQIARRRAQDMLDATAVEIAMSAKVRVDIVDSRIDTLSTSIQEHVKSCTSLQRGQLIGIIVLLVSMLAVLIRLYVLPQPTVTTTTTIREMNAPAGGK